MSTTTPQTPENTTSRRFPINRSFTVPAKVAATNRTNSTAEIGATAGVETLYTHTNAKIVKFASGDSILTGSNAGASSPGGLQGQGTLPWATLSEQTLAAGPLEVYRVPGSVSFIRSGSLLHAILPRSNCWCVDGVSKFAMRVLANTYYRIELPGSTPEDLQKVEEFKETLKKVLFYERTPCPFARTFDVDLPEEIQVRKKKRRYHGPAKRWKLSNAHSWRPEDGGEPPRRDSDASSSSISGSEEEDASSAEEQSDSSQVVDQTKQLRITPSRPSVRERARGFNMRSVTAPPQMALQANTPSRLRTTSVMEENSHGDGEASPNPGQTSGASNSTTLHPFQAIPTDMPPSPPDSSAGHEFVEPIASPAAPTLDTITAFHSYTTPQADCESSVHIERTHMLNHLVEDTALKELEVSPMSSQQKHLEHPTEEEQSTAAALLATPDYTTSGLHDAQTSRSSAAPDLQASGLPGTAGDSATALPSRIEDDSVLHEDHQRSQEDVDDNVEEHAVSVEATEPQDPFAQIQARIQARRSIGGTTSFHLRSKSPTSGSSSSSASSRSGMSHRSKPSQQQQHAFASALVHKAYATFLGPPANLVMIMLRIAARFAKGIFPSALVFESPEGLRKRVPGSFDLDGSDVEDMGLDDGDSDWVEDDFGVPLRSPVRRPSGRPGLVKALSQESAVSTAVREHVKGRNGWAGLSES